MAMHFLFREQLSSMARERLETSIIGTMIKLVGEHQAISFGAGEPSADLFPVEELKEAFGGVFDDPSLLGYYGDDYGFEPLREWIAHRMHLDDMAPEWVNWEHILLTNGAGEGIDLVAEALIDPGCLVLVESPTYTETLLTFRKQGATCVSVPSDEEGILPEALESLLRERSFRFLYTIPNFQNPSGRTVSLDRRKAILAVLQRYDLPILEDDPYHYLSYDGAVPTSYLKLAGEDQRVIHCNSFSKIVAPGMRTGWVVVPPALKDIMTAFRVSAGLTRPAFVQKGLLNLLNRTDFSVRLDSLRAVYKTRRNAMIAAIERELKPLGVQTNVPKGGFFIWGKAPQIKDMIAFALRAVEEEKVGIIPGAAFFPTGQAEPGTFRLSYAKVHPQMAEEGVHRLARAFKKER